MRLRRGALRILGDHATMQRLNLAFSKAAALPKDAHEKLGRDLLDHIETLSRPRGEIDAGLAELDEGQGAPLDVGQLIRARQDLRDIWRYYARVASPEFVRPGKAVRQSAPEPNTQ